MSRFDLPNVPPQPLSVAIELASRDDNPLVALSPGEHRLGSDPRSAVILRGEGVKAHHATLNVSRGGSVTLAVEPGAAAHLFGRPTRGGEVPADAVISLGEEILVLHRLAGEDDLSTPAVAGLRGRSASMRALARTVRRFAPLDMPVLIQGPSGTGKDAVAAAIHGPVSARSPFVVANVASLPRELCESELFGHTRGAFTGADREHPGLLAQAHGGTIFLDEIGELPLDVQPKLLRALDGYGFRPIGGRTNVHSKCRIVTASHVDLRRAVRSGAFRNDLMHRLEVLVVRTPGLDERRTDIAAIACGILRTQFDGGARMRLTPRALAALMRMTWEGNVRELRNLLMRAAATVRGNVLDAGDIARADGNRTDFERSVSPTRAVELLAQAGGNVTGAARRAGLARTTFRRRLEAALAMANERGAGRGRVRPASLAFGRPIRPGRAGASHAIASQIEAALALEVAEHPDDFLASE